MTDVKKITAGLILAAGRGHRMGDKIDGPKQYQPIGGLKGVTVLGQTVDSFLACEAIDMVQVVIHPDDMAYYIASVTDHPKLLPPVHGGATRQESSCFGLEALSGQRIDRVLIHDAARPFVTGTLIDNTIAAIADETCALPAVMVSDTVKRSDCVDGNWFVRETLSREGLFLAQTPQGFVFASILAAHRDAKEAELKDFTDDCAVAEWSGMKTRIVEGDPANTKITTFEDLQKANMANPAEQQFTVPDVRTGLGYDVHRLVPGDGVILCGITLPSNRKLDGHSDADVALHALTDALLGTIGDGDIGSHFPPSDPVWSGAASDRFLAHACALVREKSGTISHLDVTIIGERPKIGPYREAMRERVADICALDLKRISVKATTHERIGSLGREEGIAAMATATVVMT